MQDPIRLQMVRPPHDREHCAALAAIRDALAILSAIEEGELLDALPELDNDRHRHQTGKTMLALLEQRLREAMTHGDGA